jgi:ABC-type amino acid transport substrate-binding protein
MKKLTVAAAVFAAAATALLAGGSAQAATPPGGAFHETRIVVPMKVTGFDAAVAKAHGYEIRTDAQGRQYSVKIGSKATATPNNQIDGNCGSSYIYITGSAGPRTLSVDTGFNVIFPADSFYWRIWLTDNGGVSTHTWGGGLFLDTGWEHKETYRGMTPGPAYGNVDLNSDAILVDGEVCTTGGPWASALIGA